MPAIRRAGSRACRSLLLELEPGSAERVEWARQTLMRSTLRAVVLLGLLLAYAAAYVVGALVLLRLVIGEWPDLIRPGSRRDWFVADLEPERQPFGHRVRAVFRIQIRAPQRLDPRRVDMTALERTEYALTD